VLMTALPPTLGHLHLIQFSEALAPTTVIVSTQPDEPYPFDRYNSIRDSVSDNVEVVWFNETIEQNAEAPGFWDMWRKIMTDRGFKAGDYIVASEPYGMRLAQELGGVFMPYDMNRDIAPIKATGVRNDTFNNWHLMIPNFRRLFVQTVTFFGAESTGKTTLSKEIAKRLDCIWMPEWARPYLETVSTEITTESMTAIWKGQEALQQHALNFHETPFIIQDTDLFSTVGNWDFWDMNTPQELVDSACLNKSDLYLITQSNIPFEQDPIRYGGDKRESDDKYWIDLCERYDLNYQVIESVRLGPRIEEAHMRMVFHFEDKVNLKYDRKFN